ncbi:DNA primase [Kallotenue papyrolyticum]|uniref:DNA primase n=1 Tax=Kallotenue papyrolyticum TaxID=1325125 RepID=UPI00049234ED|nr:DNA primase [Kallotenue papyrolyticum]
MSITDDIKQRLDIVEVISTAGVSLRKAGRNFTGFCPFHPNTRTPAFYVFPHTQSYYCFSCHASGDVFTFVMQQQGLDFGTALRQLAARAGVQLEERTPEREQEDAQRARLRQINEAAAVYWQHLLRATARGAPARAYLQQRQISSETAEAWQLGYAADDWSDLLRYLSERGFEPEELERAGLVIRREQGGYYDRFRHRLIFPIRDAQGTIVGFGGRALGNDHAKYMNTPETALFQKSRVLYGIDQARDAIRREDAVVLVEGYIDVLMAHQHGFRNVVAPMGTALTAEQVGMIKKLTQNVYLALDADAAGANATLRGLQTLREHLDARVIPVPTPHGYVRWERELVGAIRIIALPAGRDPDEVLREDPAQWRALLAAALPLMEFYLRQLTADLDLRSAQGRATAVERLAPLINALPNPVEREHYAQRLATLLGLSTRAVAEALGRQRRGQPVAFPEAQAGAPARLSREDHLLSLLLRFPAIQAAVEAELASDLEQFPQISEELRGSIADALMHIENRQIWEAWCRRDPAAPDATTAWLATLDPYLRERAQRLLTYEDEPALPVVGRQHHATELACKIARELRRTIVQRRREQILAMYESVEDHNDRMALLQRFEALNHYQTIVTAPRRSRIFFDLRDRLDQHLS